MSTNRNDFLCRSVSLTERALVTGQHVVAWVGGVVLILDNIRLSTLTESSSVHYWPSQHATAQRMALATTIRLNLLLCTPNVTPLIHCLMERRTLGGLLLNSNRFVVISKNDRFKRSESCSTHSPWIFCEVFMERSQICFVRVVGAYDFTARSKHKVSFQAGEPVHVLEPHNTRGSHEWSLVDFRGGQRGYMPSNNLAIMPVGAGLPPGPGFFL
ncbi:hypothetical protein ACER0C_024725 [Sarotherodon galilaeus]